MAHHHLALKLLGLAARVVRERYLSSSDRVPDNGPVHLHSPEPTSGPKSWQLFGSGNAELDRGNYVDAIRFYDAAIAIDAHRLFYFIHRGIAKAKIGDFNGAREDYGMAKKLDPKEFKRRAQQGLPCL